MGFTLKNHLGVTITINPIYSIGYHNAVWDLFFGGVKIPYILPLPQSWLSHPEALMAAPAIRNSLRRRPRSWYGELGTGDGRKKSQTTTSIPSMYGIFTYIWLIFMVNVGKYTHTWILWDCLDVTKTSLSNNGIDYQPQQVFFINRGQMVPRKRK